MAAGIASEVPKNDPKIPQNTETSPKVGIFGDFSADPQKVGPATTQNLVVKFDGEIWGGFLVENASDNFPTKEARKPPSKTSPEVHHQFRRNLRRLHSGNRWCLKRPFVRLFCDFGPGGPGDSCKWRLRSQYSDTNGNRTTTRTAGAHATPRQEGGTPRQKHRDGNGRRATIPPPPSRGQFDFWLSWAQRTLPY